MWHLQVSQSTAGMERIANRPLTTPLRPSTALILLPESRRWAWKRVLFTLENLHTAEGRETSLGEKKKPSHQSG